MPFSCCTISISTLTLTQENVTHFFDFLIFDTEFYCLFFLNEKFSNVLLR